MIPACPRDEDKRLDLAHQLEAAGDPRGTFMRLQLERVRADRAAGRARSAMSRQERDLLSAHADAWCASVAPFVRSYGALAGAEFHAGCIELVRVETARFLEVAPTLFAHAPIAHLDLLGAGDLEPILNSPFLPHLRSLGVLAMAVGDAGAQQIAASPALSGLRWLQLSRAGLTEVGVRALAASPHLRNVQVMDLALNPCDPTPKPAVDQSGWVASVQQDPFAAELQRDHGPLAWLDYPWERRTDEPGRFRV